MIIAVSVILRYLLSYARATLQDSIGTERAAEERNHIGEILKRVPLGYFSKNSTGEILADLTSEFSQLELNGMSMINIVLNGYINFVAIVSCLCIFSWQAAIVAMISAVKSFGQEGPAFSDMERAFRDSRKINIDIEKSYIPWNAIHLLALKVGSVIVVWLTAWNTTQRDMPFAFLLMMSMFAFFMFAGIEAINDSAHVLGMIGSAMDKIDQLEQAYLIDESGKDLSIDTYDYCTGYFEKCPYRYPGRSHSKYRSRK